MDTEWRSGLANRSMKASTTMDSNTEGGSFVDKMGGLLKESSEMERCVGKELICGVMGGSMQDSGLMGRCRDAVPWNMEMEGFIKESF